LVISYNEILISLAWDFIGSPPSPVTVLTAN